MWCAMVSGCVMVGLEFAVQVGREDRMHGPAVDMSRFSVMVVRFRMDVE